jgi:DNA polymerase-3 subunit alpha
MCIQTGKTMSDPNRMHWDHPDFYLKSRDEMMALFGELEDAVNRPGKSRSAATSSSKRSKSRSRASTFRPTHTTDSLLRLRRARGFRKTPPAPRSHARQGLLKHDLPEYVERLEREIKMIQQMKFSGYFLIVWDFIRYAKSKNIPVGPGRGSAAGSLVGYAMQITDIDPLQYGLLFERFLNPERISMPDIDIDFCMNRRGEVIQYVTEKYGREQVAQIITFNTLGARAAIKDVGRVLDMSFADVDRLTKLVPNVLNIKLKTRSSRARLRERWPRKIRASGSIRSRPAPRRPRAQLSVHAAGVVISPQPLKTGPALQDQPRRNRHPVRHERPRQAPLLKMDFLGLTTLTLIDDALKMIEKRHGVKVVPEDLPLDDPAAYESSAKASPAACSSSNRPACATFCAATSPAASKI